MMKEMTGKELDESGKTVLPDQKRSGVTRIGVMEPKSADPLQLALLQQQLAAKLNEGLYEAITVSSPDDARSKQCDLLLNSEFIRMKQAGKVGGLLKAIKNADPNAASSFTIEASLVLTSLADGSVRTTQNVNGKFEGKADDAAGKALEEGGRLVLKALK
jgi:hypothetical protein